jgi:deazaflavin-dependent oxidoreductase (nitroreductase family)
MELERTVKDLQMRAMNCTHRVIRAVSGGRLLGDKVLGMDVVELHVVGRKSGERRSTMLTAPVRDGDAVVLVASKGGDERDPEWYRNLVANPHVELTIHGTTLPYTARTASADEKAELWPRIVAASSDYGSYQRRTGRDIPVVICEPAGSE